MSSYRCFRCGRALSNETSVANGIGPICAAKRHSEVGADRRLSLENSQCHHGFNCYAPEHGATTIGRFHHRFNAMAEQVGLPGALVDEIESLIRQYLDALGLSRDAVEVPRIDVPPFGDRQAMIELRLPIERGPFGPSVKMPTDYDDQYRRLKLRECAVCPFSLDCREPGKAVAAIWNILSIMRYDVEPWLKRASLPLSRGGRGGDGGSALGWEWDQMIYQHLANSLEVLGLYDDGQDIQDIARAQHDKRFAKRAKHAALNAAMW